MLAFKNLATDGASTYLIGITVKLCLPAPRSLAASMLDTIKFLPSLTYVSSQDFITSKKASFRVTLAKSNVTLPSTEL